jgi:hypothetical protein
VRFDPQQERVLEVSYPAAADTVHSPFCLLGDDSVLLKYLNPHIALITTVGSDASLSSSSAAAAASVVAADSDSNDAAAATAASSSSTAAAPAEEDSFMYWTLVDTVTGKIVLRLRQESAVGPVHSVIVENHIVSTYWNAKVRKGLEPELELESVTV